MTVQLALIRHVFALIQDFRFLCRQCASRSALAESLRSVMQSADAVFQLNHRTPRGVADFNSDRQGCLAELRKLLEALSTSQLHSSRELSHELDPLIIQLVRIKPECRGTAVFARAAAGGQPDPSAVTSCRALCLNHRDALPRGRG